MGTASLGTCSGEPFAAKRLAFNDRADLVAINVEVADPCALLDKTLGGSNSAMQAVGCIAARMCNSNNCPVGVATQKPELRKRLDVQVGAERLSRYFSASVELMQVLARACGHDSLSGFTPGDITTWKREVADLSGIRFAGVS